MDRVLWQDLMGLAEFTGNTGYSTCSSTCNDWVRLTATSSDVQHEQDQQSATLQHEQDQASALDQQRAAILQTYMDNIQDLLLNHHLLVSKPTDDVAVLARARTLAALQGLDPGRKGSLVQFIYDAQLIFVSGGKNNGHGTIIGLYQADLRGTTLSLADLRGAVRREVT